MKTPQKHREDCVSWFVQHHGFTLTEMLVVTSLFLIIGAGLLTTFLSGQSSYLSADAYIQVQQESRKAFDNVVRELRESGNISCGVAACADATCPSTCAANTSRLNFQIATGYAAGPGISWDSGVAGSPCKNAGATWNHYAIIAYATPPANGTQQLVRYCDGAANAPTMTAAACVAPTCRVLAHNVVVLPAPAVSGFIATDTTVPVPVPAKPNLITFNLQVSYANPRLPGGAQSTGSLTSRVRLRNSY